MSHGDWQIELFAALIVVANAACYCGLLVFLIF